MEKFFYYFYKKKNIQNIIENIHGNTGEPTVGDLTLIWSVTMYLSVTSYWQYEISFEMPSFYFERWKKYEPVA